VAVGLGLPTTLDPTTDTGWEFIRWGMGETLTRLTPEQKLEPWLAESFRNVDPFTWRVTLRPDVRFWDGSPMTAEAVAASFKRNWERQPGASPFISKETQVTVVDQRTLIFKSPRPAGDLPFSLATQFFVVHRPDDRGAAMTGPYRPTRLDQGQELALEAFPEHWAGPPPIRKITAKLVQDPNARVLGLQSGDLDLLYRLPPGAAQGLGPDIETLVRSSTRVNMLVLNCTRPPFSDRMVREATSLGIDRAALNQVGLDGLGTVATGLFPPDAGVEVVDAQFTDPGRAAQLLDQAGWRIGSDGVRIKDGVRLAFTIYSYPSANAENTPTAVGIQAQLKPLGYEIQIQEVRDITAQVYKDRKFDAAMGSLNAVITGDPQYMFAVALVEGGAYNYGGYANPGMEQLVEQLRAEPEPARRQALSRQAQELIRPDVPNLYLVAPPMVAAFRKGKVQGYTLHPNDLYFIDHTMEVMA
jgi:peptide/nickel transport system substrate-binding protein